MDHGKASGGSWDPALLMMQLNQGHELTRRLETQLRDQQQHCPDEIRALVHGILASWEKAKSMAAANSSGGHMLQHAKTMAAAALTIDTSSAASESPRSASESPPSGGSDMPFSDHEGRDASKKRKAGQLKWTQQVHLSPGTSLESPIDDGYSWRKYGQKDILGAKYPRAYYRCTHRHSQGCPATKHVQRTDDNPSLFDVTYKGKHTCFPRQPPQQPDTSAPPAHHDSGTPRTTAPTLLKPTVAPAGGLHNIFMNFGTGGLTIKTEETTDPGPASSPFPAFSFPSTPLSCPARPEASIFSCSPASPAFPAACSSGALSSPPFLSPATSESNYFSMSPCHVSTAGYTMGADTMHSELAEIISAATSTTSSQLVDLDFSAADLDAELLDSSFFSWAK